MRADDTVRVIVILPHTCQQTGRDASFAIFAIDHELRDPADAVMLLLLFLVGAVAVIVRWVLPTTSEEISRENAVDGDPDVGAVAGSETLCA